MTCVGIGCDVMLNWIKSSVGQGMFGNCLDGLREGDQIEGTDWVGRCDLRGHWL